MKISGVQAMKEDLTEIKSSIGRVHSRISTINTEQAQKLDRLLERGK